MCVNEDKTMIKDASYSDDSDQINDKFDKKLSKKKLPECCWVYP